VTAGLGQAPAAEVRPARRYQLLPTGGGCFDCGWQVAGRDYQITAQAKAHLTETGHRTKVITTSMVIWEPMPPGGPPPPAPQRAPRGSHRAPGRPRLFRNHDHS